VPADTAARSAPFEIIIIIIIIILFAQ